MIRSAPFSLGVSPRPASISVSFTASLIAASVDGAAATAAARELLRRGWYTARMLRVAAVCKPAEKATNSKKSREARMLLDFRTKITAC